ncbi:MAG: tetratricopeptide repeat protein [Calditrichaeota bacterium]|nr:MAG: tetratricopeptide repeat protein [Calditrichota bacterium]
MCSPDRKYLAGVLLLLIAWLTSCNPAPKDEMPITTNSPEARKLFIKGLKLYENLREDEAREFFSQALEKDMDFALCHFYLADVATSAIEYQTHLKMAVTLAPKVSAGEQLLIKSLRALAENNPKKAIELRKELVAMYPNDKRAHRFLGYLYRGRNDLAAITEYQKAIELDRKYAPAYNNLGYAYRRLGQYDKAVQAFKQYIALLPDEPNPYDSIADLYTKMGKYEEGIKYYKKAVKLNKAFVFSQRKIGENYLFLGKFNKARRAFEKALQLAETPAEKINTMLIYATSYIYENQPAESIAATIRAMQLAKTANLPEWQAEILLFRTKLYLENKDFENVSKSLEKCKIILQAAQLSPATAENYQKHVIYYEACAKARQRDFGSALALAESLKVRIAQGNDPSGMEEYHRLVGFINHQQGHHATAVAHFRQAEPNDPYSMYMWAECEAALDNPAGARKLFAKVANWNENSIEYALVRQKAISQIAREGFSQN